MRHSTGHHSQVNCCSNQPDARSDKGTSDPALSLNATPNQDSLGAVVPDVHLHDLASLDDEAIDIAVALERRAVDPFAVQRSDAVDHGLIRAWTDIEAIHLLLDPTIAPRVEAGRPAR